MTRATATGAIDADFGDDGELFVGPLERGVREVRQLETLSDGEFLAAGPFRTDDAKLASLDTTLSNLRASIDLYYQQHGEYPGELTAVDAACVAGTDGIGTGGALAQCAQAVLDQLSV